MTPVITFSIPDFFHATEFNLFFLDLFKKNRQWFYDDVEIGSIYGSFPCIWNAGRYVNGFVSYDVIERTLESFTKFGLEIRHTFTNQYINREKLNDTLGNAILRIASESRFKSAVNVNTFLMYTYLTKHYPRIRKMWSTTLGTTDIQQINQLTKNDLLVLNYKLNNNFEALKQLKHPENIEILVAEDCLDNCPYRQRHYETVSRLQMWMIGEVFRCPFRREGSTLRGKDNPNPLGEYQKLHHSISIDAIRNIYAPMGFTQFKITGRKEGPEGLTPRYLHYLTKPEYHSVVKERCGKFAETLPTIKIIQPY